jgi:hypothetical protein
MLALAGEGRKQRRVRRRGRGGATEADLPARRAGRLRIGRLGRLEAEDGVELAEHGPNGAVLARPKQKADGEGGASGLGVAAVGVQGGAASGSAACSGYTA